MGNLQGRVMLGRNMKALRESRGMTIGYVCLIHDIRHRSLECWEGGAKPFPMATLAKLCGLYGYYDIYKMITEEIRFGFNPPVPLPDYKKYRHVDIFESEITKHINNY